MHDDLSKKYRVLRRRTIEALAKDKITLTPQRFDESALALVERRGAPQTPHEIVRAAETLRYAVEGLAIPAPFPPLPRSY
jgi:hypothetical protein